MCAGSKGRRWSSGCTHARTVQRSSRGRRWWGRGRPRPHGAGGGAAARRWDSGRTRGRRRWDSGRARGRRGREVWIFTPLLASNDANDVTWGKLVVMTSFFFELLLAAILEEQVGKKPEHYRLLGALPNFTWVGSPPPRGLTPYPSGYHFDINSTPFISLFCKINQRSF